MMHKAWCSVKDVFYCFFRSSIKFQGHAGWKIDDLNPIWVRLLGRSQLSNPPDLPCCTWHNNCIVVLCTEICSGLMANSWTTAMRIIHRIWTKSKSRYWNGPLSPHASNSAQWSITRSGKVTTKLMSFYIYPCNATQNKVNWIYITRSQHLELCWQRYFQSQVTDLCVNELDVSWLVQWPVVYSVLRKLFK